MNLTRRCRHCGKWLVRAVVKTAAGWRFRYGTYRYVWTTCEADGKRVSAKGFRNMPRK